jgi:Exostosin family
MNNLIPEKAFYCGTKIVYPPFKDGFYMEEYFLNYAISKNTFYDRNGRLYIPALWTNFQLEPWFRTYRQTMQNALIEFVKTHPCEKGYFTVVQHDDGPFLGLPQNTLIYGACNGQIPLPLIYENKQNTLIKLGQNNTKSFSEREILCSFVGCTTHKVRNQCIDTLSKVPGFDFSVPKKGWKTNVEKLDQDAFIEKTLNSKFALAPRVYGKSSFRFFEIFLLDCIPIYVWDDVEWLPYKDILDYSKFCISLNVSDIEKLPEILSKIDETKYNEMKMEYVKIKHMFELEFMAKYITSK